MDKKTKMLLGVGILAVAGYLVYQQMNKPKGFMNASGMVFAPQERGNTFANAIGSKFAPTPCNVNDGGVENGGTSGFCCNGKLVNGKIVCCQGGTNTGVRNIGCSTSVSAGASKFGAYR